MATTAGRVEASAAGGGTAEAGKAGCAGGAEAAGCPLPVLPTCGATVAHPSRSIEYRMGKMAPLFNSMTAS